MTCLIFFLRFYRLYGEERDVNTSLSLKDHYNRPHVVQKPGHLDGLIRGLATQHSQKLDMDYVREVIIFVCFFISLGVIR